MRKTFKLTHPKIAPARLIEAIKRDVNKYVKRERSKKLPTNVDYWDFDCKFGHTEDDAKDIHLAETGQYIDKAAEQQLDSFYLEIVAKPGVRKKSEQTRASQ
ncbi:MAG: hypothetical protein ACI8ZB_000332 [Desulforhopalus sp.]|jgi:hypothetical protein